MKYPEKKPAWNPDLHPIKLRCPEGAHRVLGWVYPDGTMEMICRQHAGRGWETRHLFNPANGESFTIRIRKDESPEGLRSDPAPMPR